MHYLYLIINLFSIAYPLLMSWDKRVNYFQKWKYQFMAFPLLLAVMIPWDAYFTSQGFWGFNPEYILGISLFHLPLEEWLFFIFIPFASSFIYEVVIYYDKKDTLKKYGKPVNLFFLVVSILLLFFGFPQWYTSSTMLVLIPLLAYHQWKRPSWLGRFYMAYVFILIPFFVVNGVLTGSFIEDQVVWYNMQETFGIRIGTIPFEDFFYCLFMMLFLITFYEHFKQKGQLNN